MSWEIWVSRQNLSQARIVERELAEGERVEVFALSANNLTYAVIGDAYGWWDLFRAEGEWGIVPAWGYAERDGQSLFGLVPMASHVSLLCKVTRGGYREISPARALLSQAYNHYERAICDRQAREANAALRPLLIAAFVLDAHCAEQRDFDMDGVLVLGASSKTALGFAMLAQRRLRVAGMTAHPGSIADLQIYDALRLYGEAPPAISRILLVDFTGDDELLNNVRAAFGGRATRVLRIGRTHWQSPSTVFARRGPLGVDRFFAPDHIVALARKWGSDEFERRYLAFANAFAARLRAWLRFIHLDGAGEILEGWRRVANGAAAPNELLLARPHGAPIAGGGE